MSSASNKYISNTEAVSIVDSDVFKGHEDQRFALGILNSEDVISYKADTIEQAYLRLRAKVYVDQTGMLDDSAKRFDGTELDKEDERSIHLVVLENLMGRVAVFACMRLIEKTAEKDSILPIEDFFPDAFSEPAPQKTIEVSRFIVRHDKRRHARVAKRALMTAGLAYTFNNDLGPILGVVEPSFERDLIIMGLPVRRLAEPKLVAEYNDDNLGIEINKDSFRDLLGEEALENMAMSAGSFIYWGKNLDNSNLEL